MDSTLAVLSTIQCMNFLRRCEPTAGKPLGTVDEDAEGGELSTVKRTRSNEPVHCTTQRSSPQGLQVNGETSSSGGIVTCNGPLHDHKYNGF